jgi:hypothetical protein
MRGHKTVAGQTRHWPDRRIMHANGYVITQPFPHYFAGCVAAAWLSKRLEQHPMLAQTKIQSNFRST